MTTVRCSGGRPAGDDASGAAVQTLEGTYEGEMKREKRTKGGGKRGSDGKRAGPPLAGTCPSAEHRCAVNR